MEEKGKPLAILGIAVAIIVVLSFISWEKVSGGFFKSFDLFADLRNDKKENITTQNDYLDPDLAMLGDTSHYVYVDNDDTEDTSGTIGEEDLDAGVSMNIDKEERQDEDVSNINEASFIHSEVTGHNDNQDLTVNVAVPADETKKDGGELKRQQKKADIPITVTLNGSHFTDYSEGGVNMLKLRAALHDAANRNVRWAVIGDSYIEGDIFTQNVRSLLQEKYGGGGTGYVAAYSEIPGFRRSVNQSCEGFELLDFRKKSQNASCLIQGVASKALEGASTSFTGSKKIPHADSWNTSRILLKAPLGGSLKVRRGSEKDSPWETFRFGASDSLHVITIAGATTRLSIGSITPGIVIQGVYLDNDKGVAVDNMSIRGYSGIRHDEIDKSLTRESRKTIDYDIIMLEFGINALSASQTNYEAYGTKMTKVVESLQGLYPQAVIIIMGIGDRGEKRGSDIHSMETITAMTHVQREVARNTGALYWDTREAMGGEDAVVDWVKKGDMNKDYIHLSHKGGERLANVFVEDLEKAVK